MVRLEPLSLFYGGTFEDTLNELFSPARIKATAARIRELEEHLGPFVFGRFQKSLVPDKAKWQAPGQPSGFESWEDHVASIPENLRQRLTEVFRHNFHAAEPLPMFIKVAENVDATHDVVVKPFVHGGVMYIGILMLCPNMKLSERASTERGYSASAAGEPGKPEGSKAKSSKAKTSKAESSGSAGGKGRSRGGRTSGTGKRQ
jgi:hypothetical protein